MSEPFNARGIPTPVCPSCNGNVFYTRVVFNKETYDMTMYFLDGACARCKTLTTLPTPLDRPGAGVEES